MSRTASAFTLSALLFLTFFAIFTSASPTNAPRGGRDIETRSDDAVGVTYSGMATWYHVGLGACGSTNVDKDFIVALAQPDWDSGSHCNKQLQITNPVNQRIEIATVHDLCSGCSSGNLDLSPGLFEALGHALSDGAFQVTWKYI